MRKRFKKNLDKEIYLDEKEFDDWGKNKTIFIGSSTDMFAENVPYSWIAKVLEHTNKYNENKYLFQTKNPILLFNYLQFFNYTLFEEITPYIAQGSIICTTIETNRWYPEIMQNSPHPSDRSKMMSIINHHKFDKYITLEPVMDFDKNKLIELITDALPKQVNIGADTKGNNLPEPSPEKLNKLIYELKKYTGVVLKKNLKRIIGTKAIET